MIDMELAKKRAERRMLREPMKAVYSVVLAEEVQKLEFMEMMRGPDSNPFRRGAGGAFPSEEETRQLEGEGGGERCASSISTDENE